MTVEMEAAEPPAGVRARAQVRGLGAAVVVLLLLGLLGLAVVDDGGSGGGSKSALAAVLDAAGKTTEVTSARVSTKGEIAMGATRAPTVAVDGVVAFAGELRSAVTMKFGDLAYDMLIVGGRAYVKVPDAARGPRGSATPWVSVDAVSLGGSNPLSALSGPSLAGGGDPTATLKSLRAQDVVRSASSGGRANVRGTSTTVYHVVVDTEALKAAMFPAGAGADNPLAAVAQAVQIRNAKVDVYVDDQGLVRRHVIDIEVAAGGGGSSVKAGVRSTTDLYDFGVAVDVKAPPPGEVTNLGSPALLGPLLRPNR